MLKLMSKKRKKKGFTLIELIVVVAIIAILAVIAVPRFTTMTDGAKVAATEANHRILMSAQALYVADNQGALPPTMQALWPYVTGYTAGDAITAMDGNPAGSTYTCVAGVITSTVNGLNDVAKYPGGTVTFTYNP